MEGGKPGFPFIRHLRFAAFSGISTTKIALFAQIGNSFKIL